jgi:hypothetical protein
MGTEVSDPSIAGDDHHIASSRPMLVRKFGCHADDQSVMRTQPITRIPRETHLMIANKDFLDVLKVTTLQFVRRNNPILTHIVQKRIAKTPERDDGVFATSVQFLLKGEPSECLRAFGHTDVGNLQICFFARAESKQTSKSRLNASGFGVFNVRVFMNERASVEKIRPARH